MKLYRIIAGEPEPPLPTFEERPVCPKCQYAGLLRDFAMIYVDRGMLGDALERTCPRCGTTWLMQCADAEEADK
jgi:ribosomal protein S27AE